MQISYTNVLDYKERNGSVSLFPKITDTVTAIKGLLMYFGWKQVTIVSEIHENFLNVSHYMEARIILCPLLHVCLPPCMYVLCARNWFLCMAVPNNA